MNEEKNNEQAVLNLTLTDPENDDDVEESLVWTIKEKLEPIPDNSKKPKSGSMTIEDDGSGTTPKTKTLIFWAIAAEAVKAIIEPPSKAPPYVPLPKELNKTFQYTEHEAAQYFLLVEEWNSIRRIADASTSTTIRMWHVKGKQNEAARTLRVVDSNGLLGFLVLKKQPLKHDWVEDFDQYFAASQQAMKAAGGKSDFPKWSSIDYTWLQTSAGQYTTANDSRSFTNVDGFAFTLTSDTGPLDNTMELKDDYVRLRKSPHGTAIVMEDADTAAGNETFLDPGGIYLTSAIFDRLRTGNYDWKKNQNCVCCRNALGAATWFSCKSSFMQSSSWWEKAYKAALSAEQSFGSRSRDVSGLEVCFVVAPTGEQRGMTVESLSKTVAEAKKSSTKIISTAAKVMSTNDFIGTSEGSNKFRRLLSTSPFGDYETWIKDEDYAAYLRGYSGYMPPSADNIDGLTKALTNLKPGNAAKAKSKAWDEKREEQMSEAKKDPQSSQNKNLTLCRVSIETITTATKEGRSSFPQQAEQMGGSASALAAALHWQTGSRIARYADTATKIVWDAPGVYSSEWLHRTAYSWGNSISPGMNQSSSNFIFGSSECNSLMTRYEKALQSLFYKQAKVDAQLRKSAIQVQKLSGLLLTKNTELGTSVLDYGADSLNPAKVRYLLIAKVMDSQGVGKGNKGFKTNPMGPWKLIKEGMPNDTTFTPVDYWEVANEHPNLSFTLEYTLELSKTSNLGVVPKPVLFYPFQRGFFTRLEAAIDARLLEELTERALSKITVPVHANSKIATVPILAGVDNVSLTMKSLSLTPLGIKLGGGKAFTPGSPLIFSPYPPPQLPHAQVWKAAAMGEAVSVGGVTVSSPGALMMDDAGRLINIPFGFITPTDAGEMQNTEAFVAVAPLKAPGIAVAPDSAEAPSQPTILPAPPSISDPSNLNNVPKGFVLSGNVKLFSHFDEQVYAYYGNTAAGMRQIVVLQAGTVRISDYLPIFAGSDFEALQLQNVQFIYNELTTATYAAGTWLQADIVFSGFLQPISDFLKGVCNQENPMLRMQALMMLDNDWTRPPTLGELGLRGSLPGMSVKIANIMTITELGIGVSLSRTRQPWPPFDASWHSGISFFGSLHLETPNDMPPMQANFSVSYMDDLLTWVLNVDEEGHLNLGFCGVEGLQLSQVTMLTSFSVSSAPSVVAFDASAVLHLRDTAISLQGYYSKADWGFRADVVDLDFNSLLNMYEDLFGGQLHRTNHHIQIDDISFFAGSTGLSISSCVTIESHTSVDATILLNGLGIAISGEVDDVHLDGDIVIKKAALDIFIGRKSDTKLDGPGTSFRFAITGIVDIFDNEISVSLYLDRTPEGNVLWTAIGSFKGAFSLACIAPKLKSTFLDLSVQEVALIASNVDGASAAGSLVPTAYTVVKGVQVAAILGPVPILDGALNRQNTPTTGLTLSAIYDASDKSFELAIRLAVPQTMSMKSGTVYSGPISLLVKTTPTPLLVLNADFFVKVPEQEPLKFSGGLSLSVAEAKLFIELKDQWWNNPFGLSKQLRLGPDLALQAGIVYVGPVYPSEIGIAAGLAVGAVSGKAALSISEAPNDELVMLEIEKLGIQDVVDFASTLLEINIPKPDDFIDFKQVKFYLSTGTTIGTIVYPPGASFSCDAVIFGKEAKVYCSVNKQQGQIQIKGSLDLIDVGPLSVSGFDAGSPAQLDVQIGTVTQSVFIDGGIHILDVTAKAKVKATLLPSPSFDIETELDFSSHLTFKLEASMKGSFTGAGGIGQLEFDVHASFHQDILDYIVAQVNTQILAAKYAVDDGVTQANKTLDAAKAAFEAGVATVQAQVDAAKKTYDAKVSQVDAALAAEQTASKIRNQQLQGAVDSAVATLNSAIEQASNNLQKAKEARDKAVGDAQQQVNNAKSQADSAIDGHLADLNNARTSMQQQFGDAAQKLKNAENDVNHCQSDVDGAQNNVNNSQRDYDNASGLDNIPAWATLQAAKAKLGTMEASLAFARGLLEACQAIVQGPAYAAAEATINGYQDAVNAAKATADNTMAGVNATLDAIKATQDALVSTADTALNLVKNSGVEQLAAEAAKAALSAYQSAELAVLNGLQAAVDGLASTAEAIAFGAANAALAIAKANTHDFDVAKKAVELAGKSAEGILDVANWVAAHALNILNLKTIELSGDLRGLLKQGTHLEAHIVGTFAGQDIDFTIDFVPGNASDMVHNLFQFLIDDVKNGVLKLGL